MRVESVRRRVREAAARAMTYSPAIANCYSEPDDPGNTWRDGQGFEHIEVPGRVNERGRLLGVPHTEIVDDIDKGA